MATASVAAEDGRNNEGHHFRICYPPYAIRRARTKLDSHDVIPEILELLRRRGPMRTVAIKDEMVRVAERKGLVYRHEQVGYALTILKLRELIINATHGIWSITSQGAKYPIIAEDEARALTREWKIRIGKIRGPEKIKKNKWKRKYHRCF